MDLKEAKQILNEKGYELLDEGKLGRALAAGALAFGLAAGHANALKPEQNYRNVSKASIQNVIDGYNELGSDSRKTKNGFIECSYNHIKFYPTKKINGIDDEITSITFIKTDGSITGMLVHNEDGSWERISIKNGTLTIFDEYDVKISDEEIGIDKANQIIQKYYLLAK